MSVYINKRPYIIINGIDSRTWRDIVVTELPPISKPKIRTQVEEVDGRDGDIITPLGYAAYDKTVKIGLKGGSLGISPSQINFYIGIFNSSGTIIFSDEPTKYYRYAIYEQIDFERLLRYRTAEITFHVQPFKFSTTEATIIKNGSGAGISANVINSGNIYSRPELLLTGSGNATVDLNSSEILSVDLDSANGAIFIDSENMNAYGAKSAINNVIAYINPVQDLHGQSNPYPAGGGKNKLDPSLLLDQVSWHTFDITLQPSTSYVISSNLPQAKTSELALYCFNSTGNPSASNLVYQGQNIGVTTNEDGIVKIQQRRITGSDSFANYNWQLEQGATATAYAPYENICEISGFTELNIIDNGVNQWNEETEIGGINWTTGANSTETDRLRSKDYIPVLPNTAYYIASPAVPRYVWFYDANKNIIEHVSGDNNFIQLSPSNHNFTTPYNAYYCRFITWTTYGTTYNNDISINYPATDTSYHAYAGNTYNIDISENPQDPDNPQVVYGGYYESKTGLLNITYGITTINNCISNRTTSYANPVFYGSINGLKPLTNNILSECFNVIAGKPSASSFASNSNNGDFAINSANTGADIQVFLRCDEYTDVTSLKNAVGDTAIIYELAEPIQIQLAPTQINNLIGLNQVFTDTNGDVAVDYRASGEAHFEQAPIVSFTCTFEDIIKGTLLNRAVTGNYDNIKLNIGLNNLVVNGSGVKQLAIDKYSRWL